MEMSIIDKAKQMVDNLVDNVKKLKEPKKKKEELFNFKI